MVSASSAEGLNEARDPPRVRDTRKLRVRDVLFGGRVSRMFLPVLAIAALLIGFAGGVIGRKTAVATEVFTSQKVRLEPRGRPVSGVRIRQSSCRRCECRGRGRGHQRPRIFGGLWGDHRR